MHKELKFKGGPIGLNSGGRGPDDYLLKPIQGGRWTLVIFEYGRNSTGDKANSYAELEAAKVIHRLNRQVCVPDMARRYQQMKARGDVPTMSGTEFLVKYGGKDV